MPPDFDKQISPKAYAAMLKVLKRKYHPKIILKKFKNSTDKFDILLLFLFSTEKCN